MLPWRGYTPAVLTQSQFTIALAVLAIVAIAAFIWFSRRLVPRRLPYFAKDYLCSKGEQAFYRVLMNAVPPGMGISMKTRLSDVIGCSAEGWKAGYGAKISQKHVDFVIIDPVTTAILLVIELDDKTHERPDRASTDEKKNKASADAGLRLIRWHVRSLPSEELIRQELIVSSGAVAERTEPYIGAKSAV